MFGGRSGAGRKEYRWKRASTSVFVRFFGKRTGSSASSNSTSAQESAPAMAVSAAGAPLGSEQMDFENSALGELAEEDMLEGMGELCYDSDEMYDEEEKGEERQGVPTDLFGVGEASAGPSALTRDEGEVLGAGVGIGATGGNAGATGAGASASAGELPAPPACEPDPREGGSSSSPPLRAPTPLEMLISNARELVTSLVRTRAPGPDGGCALISRWWSAPAAPSCRGSRFDSSCRAPRHGGTPLLLRGVGLALSTLAASPPPPSPTPTPRRRDAAASSTADAADADVVALAVVALAAVTVTVATPPIDAADADSAPTTLAVATAAAAAAAVAAAAAAVAAVATAPVAAADADAPPRALYPVPVPVPPVPMSPLPLPLPPAMTPPLPQPKKPTMPSARRHRCCRSCRGAWTPTRRCRCCADAGVGWV
jgi:hypothetical protein